MVRDRNILLATLNRDFMRPDDNIHLPNPLLGFFGKLGNVGILINSRLATIHLWVAHIHFARVFYRRFPFRMREHRIND